MTLGLLVRCRYWSILQVVAIIVYYRGRVSSETVVKGCVGSQLNLTCEETKIIQITAVALGNSKCIGASCCINIKDSDCTRSSSENHTTNVYRICDYKESCAVTVVQERIRCGRWYSSIDNDFERIAYTCVDNPGNIAEGCVGSRLNLTCEEPKVIQILSVVLGDSDCHGASCCIKNSDCTRNANANHRTDVYHTCDNKPSCSVEVLEERIGCGLFGDYILWSNNDFERITYICVNETTNETMNSTAEQESTEGDYNSDHESEFAEGCVGTRLNLTCKEMKVINITAVIVGISVGSACSIRPSVCTRYANESHALDVHRRCNDRSNCTIDVLKEVIPCELEFSSNIGVEHVRYDCVGSPQTKITSVPSRPDTTETDMQATQYSPKNEGTNDDMRSTDETFTGPNNNKDAYNEDDTGPTTDQPNSHTLPVVVVIICLIILLTVVVLFIVYRRKHRAQVKSFNPVAMPEVGNQQNESNIYSDESKTTSLHENNVPLSVPLVDEDPPVYSEMVWKDDLSNRAAADEPKPAVQAHMAGPGVYTEVNKTSKTQATSSELETDRVGGTGLVSMGDYLPDQIYSLASNDVADIYANEPAADSETIPLQDDDGQTVIENDLYNL